MCLSDYLHIQKHSDSRKQGALQSEIARKSKEIGIGYLNQGTYGSWTRKGQTYDAVEFDRLKTIF